MHNLLHSSMAVLLSGTSRHRRRPFPLPAAVVVAIDRLAVTFAPFKGVEHPSPSEVMLAPLFMAAEEYIFVGLVVV